MGHYGNYLVTFAISSVGLAGAGGCGSEVGGCC